jgi:hypothetical protein
MQQYLPTHQRHLQGNGSGQELRHPQTQERTSQRKFPLTQLRLVEGWPLSHYPIRPGATFLLDFNDQLHCTEPSDSTQPPIRSEEDLSDEDSPRRLSSASSSPSRPSNAHLEHSRHLEDCLGRMLEACRGGNLELAARVIKEQLNGEG